MKRVIIFGASGTVGRGALLECLDHPGITEVICVSRHPSEDKHPKLSELLHQDFTDFSSLQAEFNGIDGCLWAIGVPQTGYTEQQYTEITYHYAAAAVKALVAQSPQCCFVFISGAGADDTETSRTLWATVKGRAENMALSAGFEKALVFRPGTIVAKRGVKHSIRLYGIFSLLGPLMRPFGLATSTVEIGRAMIAAVLGESISDGEKVRLDSADINKLATLLPGVKTNTQ